MDELAGKLFPMLMSDKAMLWLKKKPCFVPTGPCCYNGVEHVQRVHVHPNYSQCHEHCPLCEDLLKWIFCQNWFQMHNRRTGLVDGKFIYTTSWRLPPTSAATCQPFLGLCADTKHLLGRNNVPGSHSWCWHTQNGWLLGSEQYMTIGWRRIRMIFP